MKKICFVTVFLMFGLFCWSQKDQNISSRIQKANYKLAFPLKPIDPQLIQDQDDMTWGDYHPIPGKNWADPVLIPVRKFRMALVAVDFPDQPFVITLPKNSDLYGTVARQVWDNGP